MNPQQVHPWLPEMETSERTKSYAEADAVAYDGLKGWLASFYAGHSAAAWLPVATLRDISGYHSHPGNFKKSLITALEKLKDEATPAGCRVSEFLFSADGKSVMVKRAAWDKTPS